MNASTDAIERGLDADTTLSPSRTISHALKPMSVLWSAEVLSRLTVWGSNRERRHAEAHTRKEQSGCLGAGARMHGDDLCLRSTRRQAGDDRAPPVGRRPGHHLLRHRRSLRPIQQRRARRRSAARRPRPGGDRDEVRVQVRIGRAAGPGQPAGAHQGGGRGLAQAAQDRYDRSVLSAPCRSRCAHRGRRGGREGPDSRGQGQALRPVRSRRARRSAARTPSSP